MITKSKINGIDWNDQLAVTWLGFPIGFVLAPPTFMIFAKFFPTPGEINFSHYIISLLLMVAKLVFEVYVKELRVRIFYSDSTLMPQLAYVCTHISISSIQALMLYFIPADYHLLVLSFTNVILFFT